MNLTFKLLLVWLLFGVLPNKTIESKEAVSIDQCLRGRVQIVNSFPTYKVRVVSHFPDVRVRKVKTKPVNCGEWQFVNEFPDFTIQYVDSHEDFTIQFINY
jgi:hypothetical protein